MKRMILALAMISLSPAAHAQQASNAPLDYAQPLSPAELASTSDEPTPQEEESLASQMYGLMKSTGKFAVETVNDIHLSSDSDQPVPPAQNPEPTAEKPPLGNRILHFLDID